MHKMLVNSFKCTLLLFVFLFGNACQMQKPEPLYIANDVDLMPLLELAWPEQITNLDQIFDPNKLDPALFTWDDVLRHYEYSDNGTYLEISIHIYENTERARKSFELDCQAFHNDLYQTSSGATSGVVYQYCVPYLDIERGGPDVFYAPGDRYYAYGLRIRKGNVLIRIVEYSKSTERENINRAIRLLAAAMSPQSDSP